ncbi:MAG TPA: AlkA N-terminal domain-containing protein [Acidimicrobiales bacterium]|nr:AlkA N-terminal domain-containing protein [Acidimicrobiales bacterium]
MLRELRLDYRPPLWPHSLFGHLVATAVPGVEEWRDGAFRRTLRLPSGPGIVALTPHEDPYADHVTCRLHVADEADVPVAVAACRWLLDLDADPEVIGAVLAADPVLAPLVAAAPGRRVPRTVDRAEMALRVVLGQQVSVTAAGTLAARLAVAAGEPVDDPEGGLTRLFPTPAAIAAVDPAVLAMPASRRTAVLTLARTLADGTEALGTLAGLPGIGPWTRSLIAMRALGDPDAFAPTDLGVRLAARAAGLPATPAALVKRAEPWRPWRAYAVQYLWGTGVHAINRLPL